MEETLQFEMLQPRWFSIFEIDVDIKTCDCLKSHVVVPGAQCTACVEAFCTGNNHDLYAVVNVIFHVLTIFKVTMKDTKNVQQAWPLPNSLVACRYFSS